MTEPVLTEWIVEPSYKKSLVEVQHWRKGEQYFTYSETWRSGSFSVMTENGEPPVIEDGDDLYSVENCELIETWDGCGSDYDFINVDDEDALQEFIDENSVFDLEEDGWYCDETEMFIYCDPIITLADKT
jgi:hypothetical protein